MLLGLGLFQFTPFHLVLACASDKGKEDKNTQPNSKKSLFSDNLLWAGGMQAFPCASPGRGAVCLPAWLPTLLHLSVRGRWRRFESDQTGVWLWWALRAPSASQQLKAWCRGGLQCLKGWCWIGGILLVALGLFNSFLKIYIWDILKKLYGKVVLSEFLLSVAVFLDFSSIISFCK